VKILLDECVDQRLARDFIGHEVSTVDQMGWKSKQNGELLALAAKDFEAFVTTDRNLSFQQNVQHFNIAVVVMTANTNRLIDLRPIVPALLKVLPFLKKGEVREMSA
jgi:predicted nuclease of predicted toxin-antitoxin system